MWNGYIYDSIIPTSKVIPFEDDSVDDLGEGEGKEGKIDMGKTDTKPSHDDRGNPCHQRASDQGKAKGDLSINQKECGRVGSHGIKACWSKGDHPGIAKH